ncbi:MAG: alkaline phosphatase [Alphaproteobacteria bacterium]|nr:MAG: alkaline phosphatase [Alphaproteobacteria bacterium]
MRALAAVQLTIAAAAITSLAANAAFAQTGVAEGFVAGLFSSNNIILLAVFGGAMSFALLSASWLILERGRITSENAEMKARIADLRAANERIEALVNVADQRIVVWNGSDDSPAIMGRLSTASGAPQERAEFLAFGRWLSPDSAISFESALKRLRGGAEAFDLPLVTRKGGVIEAQGRTSGRFAFVRFVELSGERSALSRLEAEHARLMATFDTIQALFDLLRMPVWLKDSSGEIYWANRAYAEAVDRPDGEAAVRDRLQLLDSFERREVAAAERERGFFQGPLPAVVSGDRRILDVAEAKTAAGAAGIAVDRGEIEAVRAMLRQTVASHRQTLDHLATPIAMFDRQQRLQFCNSSFQKLWSLGEGFLAGQPTNAQVLDAFREARKLPERPDWRKWRDGQLEIYQAVEPRHEFWHLADGQTLRVIANPHSEGGVTWVFEDVTEQLALQSNYNALMRVQGETLDHLAEAVAVFGPDGRLRLCNPAFSELWRLEAGLALAGTHVSALSGACRARLVANEEWDAIAAAITDVDEMRGEKGGRLETVDGKVLDYGLVPLPEGQSMLTLVDMTAAVNEERALKERNEALEQSDLIKSRFLQHVSYELRVPLTSIAGFAEMLTMPETGRLNAKQSEYVGHVTSAAGTLKSMIDDILDLTTIDAGAMALDIAPTRLAPLIDSCLAQLDERMRAHAIETGISIEPGAEMLMTDPDRGRQILLNLLANAVAASPDGGTVTITAAPVGDMIEIAVADQGPTVPREERQRVFDRFEARAGARRGRGSGLSLPIVKSFVELHGGTVHVEDADGRGARFVCRFPHDREAARAAA